MDRRIITNKQSNYYYVCIIIESTAGLWIPVNNVG